MQCALVVEFRHLRYLLGMELNEGEDRISVQKPLIHSDTGAVTEHCRRKFIIFSLRMLFKPRHSCLINSYNKMLTMFSTLR